MSLDAAEQVHRQFLEALESGTARRRSNLGLKDVGLAAERAAALFRSQALSRQLDRCTVTQGVRGVAGRDLLG